MGAAGLKHGDPDPMAIVARNREKLTAIQRTNDEAGVVRLDKNRPGDRRDDPPPQAYRVACPQRIVRQIMAGFFHNHIDKSLAPRPAKSCDISVVFIFHRGVDNVPHRGRRLSLRLGIVVCRSVTATCQCEAGPHAHACNHG